MPPLDLNIVMEKVHAMSQEVETALETANYDKLLQSGIQVNFKHCLNQFVSLHKRCMDLLIPFSISLKLADSNCWPP